MRYFSPVLLLVLLLLLPAAAQVASDSAAVPAANPASSLNMGWLFFKTMLILVFIIVLIFAAVFVLKKYVYGSSAASGKNEWIQVLASMQLQPKKQVSLLKVFNRILLVGITDNQMQTLAEFDDLSNIEPLLSSMKRNTANRTQANFRGFLRRNMES
ncbi:MAG: flagellar biosynthetic protein FliO [Calditrichia bacterium]